MEISQALEYVRGSQNGVLTTQRANGRPQLSNITYSVGADGVIRISVTDGRAKTVNLRRDPRASLHVTQADFWAYCVLECDVELMPVATDPHDATTEGLVQYYRDAAGEHPNWDEYREVMVRERRLLLLLTPSHAYGMLG